MGEVATAEKPPKKNWIKGIKSEFKKIIWPDKASLGKQTIAVVIISIILCALIAGLDAVIQFGLGFLF
ncbi:MAG: preprotein translocase subunit SecE [Lachnospiraceae bacterium]|jgi:preprotein translocase subunit SecE|nr:preprotein translocase subunit SecE [Lachnospiraceae bacterium]